MFGSVLHRSNTDILKVQQVKVKMYNYSIFWYFHYVFITVLTKPFKCTGRCLKPEQFWSFFDNIFIICEQL